MRTNKLCTISTLSMCSLVFGPVSSGTYAKSMDDHSNISASDSVRSPQDVLNPWDIRRDYGLSDFDLRHAFVRHFVCPLPFRATSKG
jgi:hypothetical protein